MTGFCNYCAHETELTRITKLPSNEYNRDREVHVCERCINEMLRRGEIYRHQQNHDIYLFTANADPRLHSRLTFSRDDASQRKF